MTEKQMLLNRIRKYSFALDEARLFLDSHPDCAEAVKYYEKNLALYNKAVEEYERRFAPMACNGAVRNGKWAWNTTPWPWERSEN
ncbi:MAG: spore coat protein CotJB [Ruminococcus sp.]|nr:spore coat protein CotJB [Ruminococcus sp.]